MPLVGDIILAAREQFPDIPQTLTAPSILSGTPGSGGTLPSGTYYVIVTNVNQWGETTGSAEGGPYSVSANGTLAVVASDVAGVTLQRVYVSTTGSPGGESFYVTGVPGTSIVVGTAGQTQYPGQPPNFNTAFNPDADGSSIGAFTIYRWLNDALTEISRMSGGILDMTGVQAQLNQADYVIPANPPWVRFTDVWFDGYFVQDFKRRNQWRRQFISAITFYWSVEQVNRQMVLNFYPSPNRAGTTSNLNTSINATTNTIQLTSIPAGMMAPGMCIIDNEIIIYSTMDSNNDLTGCIRGMSGTTAAAHASNATVTEYNLILAGFRQPNVYTVGQSALTLSIPIGWENPVSYFLLARYRNYENNQSEAKEYYASFVEEVKRIAFDSRQFPASGTIGGPASFLTLYPGGPFGVIVP